MGFLRTGRVCMFKCFAMLKLFFLIKLIFQSVRKLHTLVKVDAEMTNEHIKVCSIIVVTSNMKNKSRVRYRFINLRWLK